MKKFLIRLSFFCPIFFAIILFNLTVDPARLFKAQNYEKKMAEALASGSAVTDLQNTNFNERALERFLIQSLKTKKDIGVFGSSRVMSISSSLFPGKTLINNGLSAASLEDFINLYEIYRERQMLPSTVIIGVDPWIFNKNNGLVKWQQFGKYYYSQFIHEGTTRSFDFKISPQDIIPYEYQELVSISYFQAGVQSLSVPGSRFFSKQWFSLTDQRFNDKETYLPDGSRTFAKDERVVTPPEVVKKVQIALSKPGLLNGFVELDQGLKQKFIKLVESMKGDGVRVILYLPPYYPSAYDYYVHSNNFSIIKDVEAFLKNTSGTYHLTLVGSYDPHQLSIPETSFRDIMHLRDGDTELRRIFLNVIE